MDPSTHFKGKDAISHLAEEQAKSIISASEIHGTEVPAPISAGSDAIRDTSLLILLLIPFLMGLGHPPLLPLFIFLLGWLTWRTGRAAWLAWSRLERLHRVLEQEKWEIDHNRQQERDELRILYLAKGFQGKLLEDVLDVLMADGDRLLRVMVEEELGLSLEKLDHPFKQGLAAGLGTLFASALLLTSYYFANEWGLFLTAIVLIGGAAAMLSYHAHNRLTPAIVWNIGLAIVSFGLTYYLYQLILR